MMFLELLASLLYKKQISVEAGASHVGRALQIRIHLVKNWYESIGDISEEGQQHHFDWLSDFTGKVVVGDPESLRFCGLDEPLNVQVRAMKEGPNVFD